MPTSTSIENLLVDLAAEHAALDDIVRSLDDRAWDVPTPSAGWAVRDQIGHLTFFDGAATRAVLDPAAFAAERDAAIAGLDNYVAPAEARARELAPALLLAEWRSGRRELLKALAGHDAAERIEWYGPPMSARSFLTARLMETWAHGLDVADGLGRSYPATERLRHVAHLGVATRGWSFIVRGLAPPREDVRVVLEPPAGGEPWAWGDAAVGDRVTGSALDFCMVVTQRRLLGDAALTVDGPLAQEWMARAQVFAGPSTETDPRRGA